MANLFNQLGLFGASAASQLPQQIQPAKLGLLDRLGQRLVPSDSQWQPTDDERKAMVKRGLLEAGLTMLATPTGAGNSPVMGIARGLLAGQQGIRADAEDMRSKALGLDQSAGLGEWNLLTRGLSPEERAKAARIKLGLDGRASGAAIKYAEVKGADGRTRWMAFDPNDPNKVQLAGGEQVVSVSDNPPLAMNPDQINQTAMKMRADGAPVAEVAQWADQQFAAYQLAQGAGNSPYAQPQYKPTPLAGGAMTSRTPEEDAALKKRAELQAELDYTGAIAERKAGVDLAYAPQIAGASTAAQEAAKTASAVGAKADQRTRDANDILKYLDDAEKLLPGATGSVGGFAADKALSGVGYGTKGSQANAQLDIIASELVRRVPRFEGPQSDADRLNYERAAGDLANPLKPVAVRLAALKTMRQLQTRASKKGRSGPEVGTIKNGYRFKGGDPASPQSWEKL